MKTSGKDDPVRSAAYPFLALVWVVGFMAAISSLPVVAGGTDLWSDDSEERIDTLELTREKIDLILNDVEKRSPEQARQLRQWRKDDPFRFVVEVRRIAWAQRNTPQNQPADRAAKSPSPESTDSSSGTDNPGRWRETLEKRMEEFLDWFKIHYPEQEKALQKLRKDDYEEFLNRVSSSRRRYEPIMRAQKRNPDLAEILKKDIEMQDLCAELLTKIATAKDKERNVFVGQLQKVVASQFDIIVRKRLLKYNDIESKINQMQQEVRQQKQQLEQLIQQKDKATRERMEELLTSIDHPVKR